MASAIFSLIGSGMETEGALTSLIPSAFFALANPSFHFYLRVS